MTQKLFKVIVEVEVYIMAENEGKALREAERYAADELHTADYFVSQVQAEDILPLGVAGSLPYNDESKKERTIREILAKED